MRLTYAARALGSTQLTRVQLIVDGRVEDDTGAILQRDFTRTKSIPVALASDHVTQVLAEAVFTTPAAAINIVRCPGGKRDPRL